MSKFNIGDTVQIQDGTRVGGVGTVVYYDEPRDRWLVRIGADFQNYYTDEQIELFQP